MKNFEISSKEDKNGRRKFKVILHTIHPDSCIDEKTEAGTEFNKNGITWIREYCEKALPSIKGMSIRCEFADDERTQILGHGETDIVNGEPVFEDAVVLGTFTDGYIQDIMTDDGVETVCIGEGEIDAQCYHNFVTTLEENIANDIYPSGSVEIMHTSQNESIVYKYGYKNEGRIPTDFIYSGYALLGIAPADDSAKLIELNEQQKEESKQMTELEIRALVSQVVTELSTHEAEINQCKADYEAKITELNAEKETITAEKNELAATVEQLKQALAKLEQEKNELYQRHEELYRESEALRTALAEAQAKERIGEMNSAIADFSDDEKAYAQAEINAFMESPMTVEINSVVNKILEGIGKTAKENEAKAALLKTEHDDDADDIFSGVESKSTDDINIF